MYMYMYMFMYMCMCIYFYKSKYYKIGYDSLIYFNYKHANIYYQKITLNYLIVLNIL